MQWWLFCFGQIGTYTEFWVCQKKKNCTKILLESSLLCPIFFFFIYIFFLFVCFSLVEHCICCHKYAGDCLIGLMYSPCNRLFYNTVLEMHRNGELHTNKIDRNLRGRLQPALLRVDSICLQLSHWTVWTSINCQSRQMAALPESACAGDFFLLKGSFFLFFFKPQSPPVRSVWGIESKISFDAICSFP